MIFDGIQEVITKAPKEPKYEALANCMKSWIARNQVPPGTKLPNNRYLAQFFNVTPVTINRSLQKLAQQGLLDLKKGSGTYIASPQNKTDKVMRIGVFCADAPKPDECYVSVVLNAFHEFWKDYKSDIITLVKNEKEYRKAIEEYFLDGAMVLTPKEEFESEILALQEESYPIVSIGLKFNSLKGCSFGTDHKRAGNDAVKFLTQKGHRNIGIIFPAETSPSLRLRREGYQSGMWDAQLPINPNWIITREARRQFGMESILKGLMSSSAKPTAFLIAAHSDIIPVYNLLNKLNIDIPNDISLIAFDDPGYASQLLPPLTVQAQPIEKFTQKAAMSLLNQISKGEYIEFEEDLPMLMQRESVATL
jgi:DNA-binding LacI/PurR family transcriptional regulator